MFDTILNTAVASTYDFRTIAHPNDPLHHRFADWVAYYRLKWAIAKVLQPRHLLEVGVRYGYSAHAFLSACPTSHYCGLDNDSDSSGGVPGAIDWARQILQPFAAACCLTNSQTLDRFPGDVYDLIHIDGQQDGDSSCHDLNLALQQSRYILVDGIHWSTQNFLAVHDFLAQHRDQFDWYGVIPGYAGELLIKAKVINVEGITVNRSEHTTDAVTIPASAPVATPVAAPVAPNSLDLRSHYDHRYYTQSCHGFDHFAPQSGQRLHDDRLQAVAVIASLKPSGRVLDLGCGRGELAYYFAQQGFAVTAIDYSPTAIALAQQCFADQPEWQTGVTWHCADVNSVELPRQHYDLVIATDLIEHLTPAEVVRLYDRIGTWLKPDGLMVLHTFPNRWYYQYDYARKRRLAKQLGAYLPQQPRSLDEQRLHINEQSPRILKQQLQRAFPHSLMWFSGAGVRDCGGSLIRSYSHRQLGAAPHLYAIASPAPIAQKQLYQRLQSQPIRRRDMLSLLYRPWRQSWRRERGWRLWSSPLVMNVIAPPTAVFSNQLFELAVILENHTQSILHSQGDYPIAWSYRWYDAQNQPLALPSRRTALYPPAIPTTAFPQCDRPVAQRYFVQIIAPELAGQYTLQVTLVQEQVRWFDRPPLRCAQQFSLLVTASP
jgi:2-polyprenyl-3-methyl-5-hydroxy-6-metoxy-1,4-benzoquinol methylase